MIVRIIAINALVLCAILGTLELITRAVAPDYANGWFTPDVTGGNPIHRHVRWGHRVGAAQVDAALERHDPQEKRVLFAGDSVTFGYGVRYEDTYHQVAAAGLAAQGCRAVVHGLGRLHSNLQQLLDSEFGSFALDAGGFDPDVLIYQFNPNDVRLRFARRKQAQELTVRERFEVFRISWLNRSAFLKWVQSASNRAFQRSRHTRLEDSRFYAPKRDPAAYARAWAEFETALVEIRDRLAARGTELRIVLVPESYQISDSELDNEFRIDTSGITEWPSDKVTRIAQRYAIPVFDVTPALRHYRQSHPDERMYFPNDANHPTATGHRVIGEAVAGYLRGLPGLCPAVAGALSISAASRSATLR